MNARQITWDDVEVQLGWLDCANRRRIYVRLKKCSFVSHICWLKGIDRAADLTPGVKDIILLKMNWTLGKKLQAIESYIVSS